MPPDKVNALRQTLSSYLGHFKHADTHRLVESLWAEHGWLAQYFILDNRGLHDRFKYRGVFRSLKARRIFSGFVWEKKTATMLKVGKFYEFFDADALNLGAAMGLKPVANRRG